MSQYLSKPFLLSAGLLCAGMLYGAWIWTNQSPPASVAPDAIMQAFADNELRALDTYRGKLTITAGFVTAGKSSAPWIIVAGRPIYEPVIGIQCHLSDGQIGRAGALSPGDSVTITGEPFQLLAKIVHLKNCRIR